MTLPDLNSMLIQLFAGLSRGMVLFLLSAGLSLIFGVMNILNFAHATFWLLGGYVTVTIYSYLAKTFDPGFALLAPAVIGAVAVMVVVGLLVERFLIRRMYGRELPEQLLLTFALVLILGDVIKLIWGVQNRRIFVPVPPMEAFGVFINPYHFFLIGSGVVVAVGLWALLHRTRYGKIVRAAVYSREMVSALGIRIPPIYARRLRARRRHRRLRRRHLHPAAADGARRRHRHHRAVLCRGGDRRLRQHSRDIRRLAAGRRRLFVFDPDMAGRRARDRLPDRHRAC